MRSPRSWMLFAFHALAADQLIEVALLTTRRGVLHEQGEVVPVELLEPLVPVDPLQRVGPGVARKIQPQQAGPASAGPLHTSRLGTALFRPFADLVVVGQRPGTMFATG